MPNVGFAGKKPQSVTFVVLPRAGQPGVEVGTRAKAEAARSSNWRELSKVEAPYASLQGPQIQAEWWLQVSGKF